MLQISPELILQLAQNLIEHDKWKLLEKHRHEKELELLRLQINHPKKSNFNEETSGGECNSSHEGLISRVKVQAGARRGCKGDDIDVFLLTTSWCGKRLERWPSAKDANSAIKSLRSDFSKLIEEHSAPEVLKRIESFPSPLDLRILSEQVEEVKINLRRSFSNSPLAKEFIKVFPHIPADMFENVYNKHRGEFVQAGIYVLRREFKKTPPDGVHVNPEHWPKCWPQYLPNFLVQWQKDLKSIEKRMRVAQKAWLESMY